MSNNFGIGFRGELVAFLNQLFLERDIVLDDAVMHHDNFSRAIAMRVGIFFRGSSVSGPAGVADAISAINRTEPYNFFQIAQLAFGAADLQACTIARDRNSRRVVAAIFEPF